MEKESNTQDKRSKYNPKCLRVTRTIKTQSLYKERHYKDQNRNAWNADKQDNI